MKGQVSFNYVPFFRLLVPFLSGIYITWYFNFGALQSTYFILFALPAIIIFGTFPLLFTFSKSTSGLFIGLAFFTIGMLVTNLSLQHKVLPSGSTEYTGIVLTYPEIKEKSNRIECLLIQYKNETFEERISEKIVIYYQNNTMLKSPEIGDSINFIASLKPYALKLNPGEFDYAKYLAGRGFIYSTYLKYPDLKFGGNSGHFFIRRIAGKIQAGIQTSFSKYSMKGTELAVLTALFAGDRTMISDETLNSYIASGAVHILSVSGMHVGILFMFFSLLLGKRKRSGGIILTRLIILVLIIWFYAFITGLSPSVIRASVMFTLFSIGKSFERQINSYNILAASAMLILLIDPLILFQVGFQLSYLAVLGIIYFQPRISELFIFDSKWVDWIWQLTTVGIAAQLATFPFSLYYFHQFPAYFWITNLLVIPLVWLIMMGTIIFFIVMPFSALAGFISMVVNYLVKFMNYLIDIISKLPGAVIPNIKFGMSDLVFYISICMIGLTIYYYGRRQILSLFLASALTIYLSLGVVNYYTDSKKNEVLVYNLNKGVAISIVEGHNHLLLADSVFLRDISSNSRRLNNFWIDRQIVKDLVIIYIDTLNQFSNLNMNNMRFSPNPDGYYLQIDAEKYLIPVLKNKHYEDNNSMVNSWKFQLTGSQQSNNDDLAAFSDTHGIILTGNLPNSYKRKWKELAENMDISCYDLSVDGVFHVNSVNSK